MGDFQIEVKKREIIGRKVNSLRSEGIVPGVIYGSGTKSRNIVIDQKVLEKLYYEAGESNLIDLTVEGEKPVKVLIQEIQKDPVYDHPVHVDFFEVRMDQKITTEIELNFVGEAPAVKEAGGTLIKNFDYLEIECLPGDLVSEIDVDLSKLKTFDDVIRVSDLTIPEGIRVLQDERRSIAVVAPPLSEKELEELEKAPEAEVGDVEVAEKGKAAEEGEEGEAKEEGKEGDGKETAAKEGAKDEKKEEGKKE